MKQMKQKKQNKQKKQKKSLFFVCRVLATKSFPHFGFRELPKIPDKLDYVVLAEEGLDRRHDVEVISKGFTSEAAAKAVVKKLGGTIPKGFAMFLDFFDGEHGETVYCWKDERTQGASQIFKSEREALDAWNNDELVFDAPLD
jgi:hypothetical protein